MSAIFRGLIISGVLLSSQLMAEESKVNLFIGLDLFSSNNTYKYENADFPTREPSNDSAGLKFKGGTHISGGWAFQGYYQIENYDNPIYDSTNDDLNEFGVDVIKSFKLESNVSPFILVGLGYGWMDIDGYSEDSATEYSLKIGGGASYKFSSRFEGVVGLDLQQRNWSDIAINNTKFDASETSTKLYLGVNYYF